MDIPSELAGARVLLMGLGLLGRGVGDALFLLDHVKELIVTDLKDAKTLAPSVEKLLAHPHKDRLTLRLGEHRPEDFENVDVVLFAAGIRPDHELLERARQAGVQVTMSTALFAREAQKQGVMLVGVTGTRGKSTIAHMLYHGLQVSEQYGESGRVFLGGNVPGVSTLALLPEITPESVVVLELDSWQLHGFGIEQVSPQIAIFSNFYPDHLNYYHSMEEYFADKANIYRFQDLARGDILLVGEDVPAALLQKYEPPIEPIEVSPIPKQWQLPIPGVHNRANAALAREALAQLGVPESDIQIALTTFKGVPGRLEYLGDFGPHQNPVYNDNNATTPEATIAALRALKGQHPDLLLIAGGTSKGLELEALAKEINQSCRQVVLLDEEGSHALAEKLTVPYHFAPNLTEAVADAFAQARPETAVLFSPAFASFGKHFKNEYDREAQFKEALQPFAQNS